MAPGVLEQILEGLDFGRSDERVLVGSHSHDDAAVYRIDAQRALVFTVDVITPIVDDPETFGRIAANNALSDVFAMGGRPLMALNVSCFSPKLPAEAARAILHGAAAMARESGCPVLGGHSVKDGEVKFGLAVVGEVHPDAIVHNDRAQDGDHLILTKGLGSAALATAYKAGAFTEDDPRYASLVTALTQSNREAMRIACGHELHAGTDVTGFGLVGHLTEMLGTNGLGARLFADRVPALPGAREALESGYLCGGARANAAFTEARIQAHNRFSDNDLALLQDPQTAGPLLLAVAPGSAPALVDELRRGGYEQTTVVGEFSEKIGGTVELV